MTKVDDDAKGRFVGSAPLGPPPATSGPGTCPTCKSPEWIREVTGEQSIKVYADGNAVPQEQETMGVSGWKCRQGHPLEDENIAELFNAAVDFGEAIGV